jgi:sugar phosphate isomerase/epimerase
VIAYSNLAAPAWSIERAAEAVSEYGYDGLELRLLDGEPIDAQALDGHTRRAVARALERTRLACLDTSLRPDDPDGILAALDLAAEWGAPAIRVFGGDGDLDRPLARAEELGVLVAIETHDEWSSARRLAGLLGDDRVRAVWDLHHPHRAGESPSEVVEALGSRIELVHVKDATAGGALVPLGEGVVPVCESLALLRDAGWDGWIVVEWEKRWHPELAEPEIALPRELSALRAMLESLGSACE